MTEAWVIPAIPLVAAAFWFAILWRALRGVRDHRHPPEAARLGTLATLTVIGACLFFSGLVYPGVISSETSRLFVSTARLTLLFGGVYVWWVGRPRKGTA